MSSITFSKAMKDPLVHFLLIGLAIFLAYNVTNEPSADDPSKITVTQAKVDLIASNFENTWMRSPTQAELENLVSEYVRDEVYYREALELGLDQDDALIRRRLRQKLEFIFEDVVAQLNPSDAQLEEFMAQHPDDYNQPATYSFSQVYLNPNKHQDIESASKSLLASLKQGANPDNLGDRLLLGTDFVNLSTSQIDGQFGREFSKTIVTLENNQWRGPVYSAFGIHLVKVSVHQAQRRLTLNEARAAVTANWQLQQKQILQDETYSKLKQNYEVVIEASSPSATVAELSAHPLELAKS